MNNQQKRKRSGVSWGVLILLIPLLMRTLDGELPPLVLAVITLAIIVAVVLGQVKKNKGKAANSAPASREGNAAAAGRKTPEVELHRPVPSMKRREPAAPAQRSFPQPEAYCVTCENTGEDHFVRDRKRRIAQLDEWLKNGLVDRQEYLVLKNRFEHDQ